MENIGVTCDVCECSHNVSGCKCELPQIKVTEQCTCNTQQVETPHYCQNYEIKYPPAHTSPRRDGSSGGGWWWLYGDHRRVTLQVARLRTRVPTFSFIWMPAKPSAKAACTLARLSSMKTHSLARRLYLSSNA